MKKYFLFMPISLMLMACASTQSKTDVNAVADTDPNATCEGFGPQSPRNIADAKGANAVTFPKSLPAKQMNLCNIHFHQPAEHQAPAFFNVVEKKPHHNAGFRCNLSDHLSAQELAPLENNHCKQVQPGDTIEVHWVHSSCEVAPGAGLGSCLSEACANPSLRVESQVFTVVNDSDALDFNHFDYSGKANADGLHQPKALPINTGEPVSYLGSTTNPKFNQQTCSPLQVSWRVRPQCAKVSMQSLSQWCKSNVFAENKAHGVRDLISHPALLSPMLNTTTH